VKILVYSPAFLPGIGGLELNVAHNSEGMVREGHEVVVVTTTPGNGGDSFPFRVVRRPGRIALLRWVRWCDVFLQHNVSLRGLWPLLLVRRPWVVAHHSWYTRTDGRVAWQDRLKRRLLRRAAGSIAVSEAMAADLDTPSVVIQNAYRDRLFRRLPDVPREGELLFVGRLVSDKGVDLLLEAMALLAARGRRPRLTVVGDGPERAPLLEQAERLSLADQVSFLGIRRGEELVRQMNGHRVLVVPSRYHEPFGIVALEGIACGCLVVGSAGGGLKEAIGPAGITFDNGDARQLAAAIDRALDATAGQSLPRTPEIEAHLHSHSTGVVLSRYLAVLEAAVRGDGSGASTNPESPGWARSSS
jgi:glycosyltransferase involved in cell wall biosynthesis